jgi:hypothetical protein
MILMFSWNWAVLIERMGALMWKAPYLTLPDSVETERRSQEMKKLGRAEAWYWHSSQGGHVLFGEAFPTKW